MRRAVALVATVTIGLVACGDGDGSAKPRLVVSAAASMTEALTRCSRELRYATVRLSFAGSDELAAQIRQGVKPDVYAAANTTLPEALHADGLLGKPVEFASNELVLAVPDGSDIASIEDLTRADVAIAIGAESVPIGAYTRETLAKLPPGEERAILDHVRSNEPDVKGIVGKLTQGAVDAGFVYATDVAAAGGELKAIELPAELEPDVTYAAAAVKRGSQPDAARRFLNGLLDGACADALREAGFDPAP